MKNGIQQELRPIKWILAANLVALVVIAFNLAPVLARLLWLGLLLFVCAVAAYAISVIVRQGWAGLRYAWPDFSSFWRR